MQFIAEKWNSSIGNGINDRIMPLLIRVSRLVNGKRQTSSNSLKHYNQNENYFPHWSPDPQDQNLVNYRPPWNGESWTLKKIKNLL